MIRTYGYVYERELPDDASDWREFVKARVGITTDCRAYFDGKLEQLHRL